MSTNYRNTFISVAPDCPVAEAEIPPMSSDKLTIAALQYELLADQPYRYTSDEVLFAVHVRRLGIPEEHLDEERERYFAKSQACLRASPLPKRYGWGIHHDDQERIAIIGLGSAEYERFQASTEMDQKLAMRSSRAR